jgi:hypothetical protein
VSAATVVRERPIIMQAESVLPRSVIVAAWGVHGTYMGRDREVRRLFGNRLHHLGLTKVGHPRHPLYLRADTPLTPWGAS